MMINLDRLITYCDLWLILAGFILGLFTALFIVIFTDHPEVQEEEPEMAELVQIRPCAWCWYEQHPFTVGFPSQASSSICERHATEQRRMLHARRSLRTQPSARQEEALYAD